MVVDLDNPLWSILVRSLHDELSVHGFQLTLVADHGDHVSFEPLLSGGTVDGVIVSTVTLDSPVPAMLKHRGIPAVLLHRWSLRSDLDSCVADDLEGGRQAAKILLESGHRRVAALFGPAHASTAGDRAAGFRLGLGEAGVELLQSRTREGGFEYAYGWESLPQLLTGRHPPTAVFCGNDVIAMGALNAAFALGIRVPDDLAIVGFDDLEESARPMVNLTTVHVPFHDMLRSAVTLLLERVGGYDGGGRRVIHPVVPVLRGTHGASAGTKSGAVSTGDSLLGRIADDLTGAADLGGCLYERGPAVSLPLGHADDGAPRSLGRRRRRPQDAHAPCRPGHCSEHRVRQMAAGARSSGALPEVLQHLRRNAVVRAQSELGSEQAAAVCEEALARVATELVGIGARAIVVTGGDTSGAVAQALGLSAFEIGPSVSTGVPWLLSGALRTGRSCSSPGTSAVPASSSTRSPPSGIWEGSPERRAFSLRSAVGFGASVAQPTPQRLRQRLGLLDR